MEPVPSHRVRHLEALHAIAPFGVLTDYIQSEVDQFSTLVVVTLGPVVTSTRLSEDEIVGTEDLAEGRHARTPLDAHGTEVTGIP